MQTLYNEYNDLYRTAFGRDDDPFFLAEDANVLAKLLFFSKMRAFFSIRYCSYVEDNMGGVVVKRLMFCTFLLFGRVDGGAVGSRRSTRRAQMKKLLDLTALHANVAIPYTPTVSANPS